MSKTKGKPNKFLVSLAALICLLAAFGHALAASGSIKVTVEEAQKGLAVNIVQVADKNAVLTESFAGAGIYKDQLTAEMHKKASAEALLAYAEKNGIEYFSLETNEQGIVLFSGLEEGIYLLWEDSKGLDFPPFLVSIPTVIKDLVIYDVEAEPKAEEPTPPPTSTPAPTPPGPPPSPSIPQTGTDMLPIWLLMGFGAAAVAAGLILLLPRKRKEQNNA